MIMGLGQHLFAEPAANTTVSPNFSKCSSNKSGVVAAVAAAVAEVLVVAIVDYAT